MVKRIYRTKAVTSAEGKETTDETEEERCSWFGIESAPSYAAIGGVIVGFATALLALASYYSQSNKDIATRILEAKKPFFEKQMAFYVDATETASKIAVSNSPDPDNINHFWQIYWGRLASVEDKDVDRAMVVFGEQIDAKAPAKCLKNTSLLLAHCIKQSWEATWEVKLAPSPEFPCVNDSFTTARMCK
jgi:hypothetical protein